MNTDNIEQQPTDPQAMYIDQLRIEAESMSGAERAEHEALIAELAGELALSQEMQVQAFAYIDQAKGHSSGKSDNLAEEQKVEVDLSKIGWAGADEKVKIPSETVETAALTYEFVDLTNLGRQPRMALEKLMQQSDGKGGPLGLKLMQELKEKGIPQLHEAVVRGKGVRSVAIGGRSVKDADKENSLNTSYPAFKIGVHGPKNRAIILKLGTSPSGNEVYGLAVLYDHDDDKAIYRTMYLK